MGKKIFLCLVGVFYFVNSSFSRILDFSTESKNISKIAGIENRTLTPEETLLIKEVYTARQEAENERMIANEWKLLEEKRTRDLKLEAERAKSAECAKNTTQQAYEYDDIMWTIAVRKEIDVYEMDFDNNHGARKFELNSTLLKGMMGYDSAEEKRRQQWVHYLKYPPSTQVKELADRVSNKTLSFEVFSERIAKTYRETSMTIHEALRLQSSKKPINLKISHRISRNEAIDILMEDVEVGRES